MTVEPSNAMPLRMLRVLVGVAALPSAAAALGGEENASDVRQLQATVTQPPVYVPPLCGFSKIRLEDDLNRRVCLRQCRMEGGIIRPTFEEWETYCRETAAMNNWDPDCEAYLGCTFGCQVWGGDRSRFQELKGRERYDYLVDSRADMYTFGITQDKRCEIEKCHAYCARVSFNTCRESQFVQKCELGNPQFFGCDVRCNGASPLHPPVRGLALLAALCLLVVTISSSASPLPSH